uniref:Acyl-coenzyme A oxidase n=1 Tax=Percolomonas cosmopolitus TaxID=63605 RepID=A0A7S1PI99_9EUKA|eukprot:CAMPEP_0117441494 /NCGR_PEP_ID=MMETSP0759-20121206/3664_1 /TAXON_ID=63605 /ORGANISM="Percolomonas cosmopolitus, Strain WS" /LENGTH=624 /DNA_ID=CAMNT_0005233351 /DNA_START=8 /DNA_END=1882 /DNA_ORIENTATION=+
MSSFTHTPPSLDGNVFTADSLLQAYLKRHSHKLDCTSATQSPLQQPSIATTTKNFDYRQLENELRNLGHLAATTLPNLATIAEKYPPQHIAYDAWQNRVDEIETHPAWKELLRHAAESGIVGDGYHYRSTQYSRYARLVQFAKLYLFDAQCAVVTCPMAMTDGAAKLMETQEGLVSRFREVYEGLISKNPKIAITAGQHMTETRGGSDVSGATETVALHENNDDYKLYGFKWFTSAIDAQVAFTLARIAPKGSTVDDVLNMTQEQKKKIPLSLFFMYIREPETNKLNGITVYRLKNKLGTKALPTAELKLHGASATLVSPVGRGIACISPMLTVTRTWNAVCAVSKMRRIIHLVRDYSTKREAFGKKLGVLPAHVQTLARMSVEYEGCFHLVMDCAKRIGFTEVPDSSSEELRQNQELVRILTPLAKMYTGKVAVPLISEGLECIGGQGYMEDSGIPAILRDAQVLPVWEGTTNVQALDVLRVLKKHPQAIMTLMNRVQRLATKGHSLHQTPTCPTLDDMLKSIRETLLKSLKELSQYMEQMKQSRSSDFVEAGARGFAFSLSRVYILALMLEHAFENTEYERDLHAAHSFVRMHTPLVNVEQVDESRRKVDQILAMGEFRSKL